MSQESLLPAGVKKKSELDAFAPNNLKEEAVAHMSDGSK